MTEAIIFDCFGVLVTNRLPVFIERYAPDQAAPVYRLEDALNAGNIDYRTFLLKLSELSALTFREVEHFMEQNEADEAVFAYIRELKPDYKISMLSNAGDDWLDELIGAHNRQLFDDIVLSFQVGFIKPQPEIYTLAAQRLQLSPEACVFVDDRQRYCDGARAAGMQTLCFTSAAQLRKDLPPLLAGR